MRSTNLAANTDKLISETAAGLCLCTTNELDLHKHNHDDAARWSYIVSDALAISEQ